MITRVEYSLSPSLPRALLQQVLRELYSGWMKVAGEHHMAVSPCSLCESQRHRWVSMTDTLKKVEDSD